MTKEDLLEFDYQLNMAPGSETAAKRYVAARSTPLSQGDTGSLDQVNALQGSGQRALGGE